MSKEGKLDRKVVGERGDAFVSNIQSPDFSCQRTVNKNKSHKMRRKVESSVGANGECYNIITVQEDHEGEPMHFKSEL